MEPQPDVQQPQGPIPPSASADESKEPRDSPPAAPKGPTAPQGAQETDPPRKRRLLFPKARPKKMQEFLGRRLNSSADSTEGSKFRAVDVNAAPPQGPQQEQQQAEGGDSSGCGEGRMSVRRSFEDAMAAAPGTEKSQQTPSACGGATAAQPEAAATKKEAATPLEDVLNADKRQMKVDGAAASLSSDVETHTSRETPLSSTNTSTGPQGGGAGAPAGGLSAGDSGGAVGATPEALSASTAFLDSSCLGVQRLTLKSPTGNQGGDGGALMGLAGARKSPPEKRPSSGACDCAEGEGVLHALGDLGDGGLGPLKVEDFSGIPLATRLQSKAIKQRAHGCDEVVGRLEACGSCEERVKLWDELIKPHLSSILKDTNALMGTKTVELLQALVGGTPTGSAAAAGAAAFPAAAALPLLQQHGKQIISQILSNPKHFSSCCDVLLQLSRASEACAVETVNLLSASVQGLLAEKKGNVAAIKGQGIRVVGSSLELLLKMLESFGLQLVVAVGGVQNLMKSTGAFAACSDKRVRGALSSIAATAVYFTGAAAGETAAAAAKKTILESLKSSKSMQTEVEKLIEKFQTEPPPPPSLSIAGMAAEGSSAENPQASGGQGGGGASLASCLVAETDVLKTVCQQQTDWVVRVTEGVLPAARGDKEAEEPPWKVKMQAWQQLETALRDCVCLYKKNPFLHQQLLPLLHRVLTAEPTLPVVTCALKTLQMLVQLLLQPLVGEGSQQLQQQLQQQLRGLLPDALAKLKVNNRPVQSAACACIGTYLSCIPLDVVVVDLLPIKEKLAHYQKLLLDEITKAVEQQAGGTSALQKVAAQLLAAGRTAADDGNAAVRAAGVGLIAAVAKYAQGSAAVGEAMQKLSEPKRQQLQKAMAAAGSAAKGTQPLISSPRRLPNQGASTPGVPFSRMRSRGVAGAAVGAAGGTAAAASVQAPAAASERTGGGVATGGTKSTFRRQASGSVGNVTARAPLQRLGSAGPALGLPAGAGTHGAAAGGGQWEAPHAATGVDEAETRTRELLPFELLQNLEAPAGLERKRAYEALENWFRQPCDCKLCRVDDGQMDTEERLTSTSSGSSCRLEALRKSAVQVLVHLRSKMRGFRERTAALEDACITCLRAVLEGLLPPKEVLALTATTGTSAATGGKDVGKMNTQRNHAPKGRQLPPVDKALVNVVLEPLGDRLGDPRVGNTIVAIGLLLAKCVDTPTTVAAQLALLAEGRVGGGRIMHGVCQLLEQLLHMWGLSAFTPPKQLLMIVRQMLEPSKGSRSVVFPLLKRLHAELGDKVMTAMLVAHPLPDEVKHALKQQRQQQQQQQQRESQLAHGQSTTEDSGASWELAVAAVTAGAAAAESAAASVACTDSPSLADAPCVSVAPYISPDMLQRLQQGQDEETLIKTLNELMHIFVNKVGGRVKPEGLSGLVSLLRKRLGDPSVSVRRHVLLTLVIFCDRLGIETPQDVGSAASPLPAARVYKQMLPAAAECLCDSDKKVMQAAYIATAKWMTALGLAESMALLNPFLSSSSNSSAGATSISQRPLSGTVLRRPFSIGASGVMLQNKSNKIREALFALLAVAMPVDPSQKSLLLLSLVPHLLDAVLPQLRGESAVGSSAANALLSLVVHEACPPESIVEVMQQRMSGQGLQSLAGHSPEAALKQLLVPSDTLKLLLKAQQEIQASLRDPLLKAAQSPSTASTKQTQLQQQDHQQKAVDLVSEESTRATTPAVASDAPTAVPCTDVSPSILSTRSQRIQRSSGAGFVTLRRQPASLREELYQEFRGRVESSLLLLMFPSHGSSAAGSNKQIVPQLSQLKSVYDAWKPLFGTDCNEAFSPGQSGSRMHPLQGEKCITDLLLKWIAFCVTEVLQQPRAAQTQESLCVLLQLLQLVMQPYNSLRVVLPLYEQQQILQQLLDVASACAVTPNAKGAPSSKPTSKQPRQLVRETLLLLAAIVEDRPRFLSAVHRSLIRCKNKELLVDLMAAMTRALGQHVQIQLQSKGGTAPGSEILSDFLSQQCAVRFFALFTDAKASSEQRGLAFDFLVLCNLALKGGTLHLLPSLSPECRARLVEATKQIAASGLSQGRLESLIARHGDGCSRVVEEATNQPSLPAAPPTVPPSQASVGDPSGTTTAKAASLDSAASALVHAVAEADALLQTGEEELRQQASALEGWITASREMHMKSKSASAAFAAHLDSTLFKPEAAVIKDDPIGGQTTGEGKRVPNISVELLCCLTALKTWCAELKLRSLPRAAFGAHSLLFLLTSAPPNPNSTAATAATKAAAAAAQAAVDGVEGKAADGSMQQQHADQRSARRSSRAYIQLTSVGEAVMSAHPLSSQFVFDGVTKALEFFFEPQHYETVHGAGLSLQGAASALLIAEAVTRWLMQSYKTSGSSASCRQKKMKLLELKEGALVPLPDKDLLQQCCRRYVRLVLNGWGERSTQMDSRLGSVRYLVTFLLNQVLGRSILQGDIRVLSCIAECCFSLAAQNLGSASQGPHRKHTDTLWRLVGKVHKKAVPLLEKHATAELQQRKQVSGVGLAEAEERRLAEALSILDLISTVVTSLSRLEGAYHAAKLLIEQSYQQHIQNRKQTEERGLQPGYDSREKSLAALQKDSLMFLLHAKIFMHSFVTLCPTLLGVHLEAAGITESAERSERLERLLRSNDAYEGNDVQMHMEGPPAPATELNEALLQVRGAEEACRGLSNFSCAASAAAAMSCTVPQIVALHRRYLEEAERAQSEDCAMQVDSPSSDHKDNSCMVEDFLKAKRTALRALFVRGGIDPVKDQKVGPFCGNARRWLSSGGHSIEQQPYDSSDDFMLYPFVHKVRECLLSPAQQRTLLQNHSSVASRPNDLEDSTRNGLHMLRFCAGTSAALPHHKLATLRAEAANRECVPTDWLDLAAVCRSYKLDPQPSNASAGVLQRHSSSAEAPQLNSGTCAYPEPSNLGKTQLSGTHPNAAGTRDSDCFANDANELTADRNTVADSAGLYSGQTLAGNCDATSKGAEAPSITRVLRPAAQRPARGSFGRSNSMRGVDGHPCELPATPVTASRLPQCKTIALPADFCLCDASVTLKLSLGLCTAAQGRTRHTNKSIASPEDARSIEAFRFVALEREKDPWRNGSTLPVATTRDTYRKDILAPMNAPAWDIMEHKVLRFFSHFNEHVDESRTENYRSRPCEILYYLEDDTMEIVEPKIDNSGMNSGSLIKRHRFPNVDEPGRLVSPSDLRVGTTFTAYGKTFAITACDAFTRVCRFRAFFDDNFTNVLERRLYTILYFPRDDTLEIRENLPPLGGNRFTIFIGRRKLLKGDVLSVGPSYPRPPEAAYFKLEDFKVGSVVTIADREFFIYAADPFTMAYVKHNLGIQLQEPINVEAFEVPSQPPTSANLRNHEEANPVYSKCDRKTGPLFIKATIADMICPDAFGREVHILFYPEEQYVSVFEPKADGHSTTAGEKLLQKSIYFNEDAQRPFEASDFVIGSLVTINRQTFKVTDVFDLSERPNQEGDLEPDQARVLLHLRRLWDGLRGNDIKSGQMFTACDEDALLLSRYFDSTGDGKVDYEEFCKGMLELQGAFLSNSQRLNETLHSNIQAYRDTAKVESAKLEDTKAIKQSFKQLQSRLYQQPRLIQLLTKEFARSSLGRKVSVGEAVEVFERCGFTQSPDEIRSILEELLPYSKGCALDYIDLLSALKSTCRGV
ncbi:EF-hand domain-containing protein 1, related [Eimeria praecox]|uniref:EF-hand domain-containing protein 1, related n=1 Tax=Eimeria praecox TaxID=51316 RepID=U6GAN9_9EIME|nr:EF-hand domain-containing protein 1, related [Eimeria praecox]